MGIGNENSPTSHFNVGININPTSSAFFGKEYLQYVGTIRYSQITDFHGAPSGCDLANVDESSDAPAVGNCFSSRSNVASTNLILAKFGLF